MRKFFILSVVLLAVSSMSYGQTEVNQLPFSFGKKSISQSVDVQVMPRTDNEKLMSEDAQRTDKSLPARVGIGFNVGKNMTNSGRMDITEDGGILWRAKFVSEGAFMTYLVFDRFNIPEEGKLFIYSPDHEQVFGPYTNKDVQTVGKLVTDDILGDEIVVEYYEPANASFKGDFQIAACMHIYKDFLHTRDEGKGPHGDAEGNCHIDVVCPEGRPWRLQANAVVCIAITAYVQEEGGWGMYLCSGATVNNTRMDKTPYVLSADHCVAATDQTHKFYFQYQTSTCGGTAGIYSRVANGGDIVARSATNTYSSSDFLLLKITGNLGAAYRDSIFFAGWDRTGAASVGVGIHHPGGDWKKISFPQSVSTITSGNMANKFFSVSWRTNPNKGVTEQGSSGSPLYNANGLIIGTLTSGSSACNYTYGKDNYGRMYYHWTNNNNSNATRKLQPWLDPDNTGITKLNGMTYGGQVITSIEDHATEASTFEVYPNPATDGHITIQGEFLTETAQCNIYNVMGQLVMSKEITTEATFSLNVNTLDNGVYFIEVLGSERNYKSKLIISK